MENWFDSIIIFLVVTSALILVLGVASSLVLHFFKIRGKASLLICSILIIMPLVYPMGTLIPNHVKIRIPREWLQPLYSHAIESGNTAIPDTIIPLIGSDKTSFNKNVFTDTQTPDPETFDTASMPWSKRALLYSIDWKLIIAIVWITFFLLILERSLLTIKKIRLLLKFADCVTDPNVLKLLRQCATETGLMRMPQLMTLDHMLIPMSVGFFHPTVILPKRLLEPEFNEGLRFTLLHELKHLKRLDNWWLLIESFISAAYFFHPVIYWAKQRIHEEWEYLCDKHVIRVTNRSDSYADFLLHEIWGHGRETKLSAAKPFISSAPKTTRRVHSILEKGIPTLFTKILDQMAVSLIFLSFISTLFCSVTPSAHVKESGTDISQVISVENPDVHNVPAKFDSLLNSTPAFSNNMSVYTLPEKTPDESAEVIHSPLRYNPKAVNTFYVSASEEVSKVYDIKAAARGEVESSTGSQAFSKNNKDPSDTARIDMADFQEHAGIDRTNIQPSVSETPVKEHGFNCPSSLEIASLGIDTEKRMIQLGDDYPVIIPADLIAFNKDNIDKKPVSSKAEYIPEKYNLDSQLERVSKVWESDPINWMSVDYQSFILENGFSYYLIVLNTPDPGLPFRETLQLGNLNKMIRSGYDNVNGYVIYRIYKFKNYEQAKIIKAQLSGGMTK